MNAGFIRALPFGATLRNPERTSFRLWAPAQQSVALEIEGRDAVPMARQAEGWFEV
jgi:maltooligosyltrehalose trehalohydrolase